MNSLFLDCLLFLLFLGLTFATPLAFPNPNPQPHPLPSDAVPSIIPGRVHPNYHDPALGLSGIQIAGIIICSLVGIFILGFLALVTWDSYQDGKRRRGMDDFDDFGFGFPVSTAPYTLSSLLSAGKHGKTSLRAWVQEPSQLAESPDAEHAKHLLHTPNSPHDADE